MKTHATKAPSGLSTVPQLVSATRTSLPQRMNVHVGSVSLRGFGQNAGPRFHQALQEAMMRGIQQRRELSFTDNLRVDRISIPPLAAGASVEDAARQVAAGLLRALEERTKRSNKKGREENAHG